MRPLPQQNAMEKTKFCEFFGGLISQVSKFHFIQQVHSTKQPWSAGFWFVFSLHFSIFFGVSANLDVYDWVTFPDGQAEAVQ